MTLRTAHAGPRRSLPGSLRAGRTRRSLLPEPVIQYGAWAFTVLLVLGPIVPIAWASLWSTPLYDTGGSWTLANFLHLFGDAGWWQAVLNSFAFAALTTTGSILVGTTLALLIARTDLPLRRLYSGLTIAPMALPGLVLVIGWQVMWAPTGYGAHLIETYTPFAMPFDLYSLAGMAISGTVIATPIVFLFARASLASGDSTLEDAARCAGARPFRTLLSVTVPLLRPALLNSGLIVFALSLESLGLPLLLGKSNDIELMSTYLYVHWTGGVPGQEGALPAGAVMLLMVVTLLLVLRNRLAGDTGRFATTGAKSRPAAAVQLGWMRWIVSAVVGTFLGCATLVPLAGVLLMAFTGILSPFVSPWSVLTTANFSAVMSNPGYTDSILNSLLIATVGAAVATACVVVIAVVAHRSNFRLRGSLEHIVLYPRAVPGLITGMAFFWTFAVLDRSGTFQATLWAMAVAFAVRSLALGYSTFYPALTSLGRDLDLAARTSGADWWTAIRTVVLRLLARRWGSPSCCCSSRCSTSRTPPSSSSRRTPRSWGSPCSSSQRVASAAPSPHWASSNL